MSTMASAQTVKYKIPIQYVAVFVLLVTDQLVCSKTIENTCPTNCSCRQDSLECSNIGLTEIPTAVLSEHVLSFVFSNNRLTYLMERAFRDYRFLEYLNLSENEIEGVDSRAFHGLARLNNIDLSYNNLQYITPVIFSDNLVLEKVSFRGNQLAYFPDSPPILASHSIASLDLSYCTLTSINADTFSQLPNLQILNLNNNKLREFNREILNTLTKLINVDLGNNMWKCDCNIVDVLNLLIKKRNSRGLYGEHKPLKCFDAGVYKKIWMAASKNESCKEQSRKSYEAITWNGTTTILGSTKYLVPNLQINKRTENIYMLDSAKNNVFLSKHSPLPYICVILFVFLAFLVYFARKLILNYRRRGLWILLHIFPAHF